MMLALRSRFKPGCQGHPSCRVPEEDMLSSDRTLRAWRRFARNGLLSEARSMQRMALGYLGILRPLEKLPDPEPTSQVQCLHMEAVSRSNQWCRWLVCRACRMRLSYLPTPQAALQVERRRTLAASRRCRASRASASSTTAGPVTANMAEEVHRHRPEI